MDTVADSNKEFEKKRLTQIQVTGKGTELRPFFFVDAKPNFCFHIREAILKASTRETGDVVFWYHDNKIQLMLTKLPILDRDWVVKLDNWINAHQKDITGPPMSETRSKWVWVDIMNGVLKVRLRNVSKFITNGKIEEIK